MLIRLMDKMDSVEREQTHHHTFAQAKLESIEAQAIKTNGRVTKNEIEIKAVMNDVRNAKTIYATLATVFVMIWTGVTFFLK